MKKIPGLFKRDYAGTGLIYDEVTEGCEWVAEGHGVATEKFDGSCCMVRGGRLYRRFDAKNGKTPPSDFEPAQELPDRVTGHWPGWVPVGDGPSDKWHRQAWNGQFGFNDGTYELVGPKVQGNLYKLDDHELWLHGCRSFPTVPRDFNGIRDWLSHKNIEGLVWHHPDGRMCKVTRRDFGLPWGKGSKR